MSKLRENVFQRKNDRSFQLGLGLGLGLVLGNMTYDSEKINNICEILLKTPFSSQFSIPLSQPNEFGSFECTKSGPNIFREDVENLSHFTQIWTDCLEHYVIDPQLDEIAQSGRLVDVGFFYVLIHPKTPILEFFSLLTKIPWESLTSPGLNQISYNTLAQLIEGQTLEGNEPRVPGSLPYRVAIQIMVLGNFFRFWRLINPYQEMSQTPTTTKLLISGMGNLTIQISPNFIKNCQELVETIDLS